MQEKEGGIETIILDEEYVAIVRNLILYICMTPTDHEKISTQF